MPKLLVSYGTHVASPVELKPFENTIGRSAQNDVVLRSIYVSRRHAVIVVEPAFTTVTDLDSQNGTFVNGERIESQTLVDGDRIYLGGCDLRFVADEQEFSEVEAERLQSVPNWFSHRASLDGAAADAHLEAGGDADPHERPTVPDKPSGPRRPS
ncbi:conserved hypothetical protein [Burkholderiales bacterium 8X]|nr:conserved hypothetical protein [Burkholderiales bacterium 8X]